MNHIHSFIQIYWTSMLDIAVNKARKKYKLSLSFILKFMVNNNMKSKI